MLLPGKTTDSCLHRGWWRLPAVFISLTRCASVVAWPVLLYPRAAVFSVLFCPFRLFFSDCSLFLSAYTGTGPELL